MKKLLVNNKGMTLVEVIVSITLLAIMFMPISLMFMNSVRLNNLASKRMVSNAVMRMVKENVRTAFESSTKTLDDNKTVIVTDDKKMPTASDVLTESCKVWNYYDRDNDVYSMYTYSVEYLSVIDKVCRYKISLFRSGIKDNELEVEFIQK